MSLRINHNISSINGHRQLVKNESMMAKSLERLSSGLKINRAADNAAGLVISEQMRAQIAGLHQAIDNSETAVSMVQTTEGALDEVNSLLTKARELVLHAANEGVNDVNQLAADQSELDNVIDSITRISDVTQFGTKKLLNGSLNGTSGLESTISHVKVGNLANNPGITAGKMNIVTVAGAKEAVVLKKVGGSDDHIFTTAVTGLTMGSKTVASGVSVALKLNSDTISYVTTGALTASSLAAKLDTLAASYGFDVAATTGGEIKVTRSTVGSTDFTSSLSFTRGATATSAGTKEAITSTLKVTGPSTNTGASSVLFTNVSKLSGIQETSVLGKTGTKLSYAIETATGGTYAGTITGTAASGMTIAKAMSGLQTKIRLHAGFSGATLALAGGVTSGINFKLTKGFDTLATDFNFSLAVDFKNNAVAKSEAHVLDLDSATFKTGANATFITGAATGAVVAGAISAGTRLASGNALNLTISGQTVTVSGAHRTMTALATALQTKIQALGAGFANMRVAFRTGAAGVTYSGLAGQVGMTGVFGAIRGFVVYNTDGKDFSVSLAVDQQSGNDVAIADVESKVGVIAGATLDLTTTAQARTQSVATVAGKSGRTVSSTVTGSTVTNGTDVTATMTSYNGVVLNLKQSAIQSDGTFTMTLTSGSTALGYKDFSAEFASSLGTANGTTSFTLNDGAVFQVGANSLQQVGLTIDDISADEMGRGASASLTSLSDLLSTKKGALLNGLSTDALSVIDAAIDQITNLRGRLGAFQANTLESGLNSLRVSNENLTAAESTIRDVDFASESAIFTRNQILVQASTSMLAQANQLPQNVLKLLG